VSAGAAAQPLALPVADRDSREWWQALARHELLLQRCRACDARRWPPRALCNRCGALDWEWIAAVGRGRVASWIVNHHAFRAGQGVPFVVLLVRLDDQDDILMPGFYAGPADGGGLSLGLPVALEFQDVAVPAGEAPLALLRWRPRAPRDDPGRTET
jgi:uncharacterized OB-fold protein